MAINGTELVLVQGLQSNGAPAASTELITTGAIAALSAPGVSVKLYGAVGDGVVVGRDHYRGFGVAE